MIGSGIIVVTSIANIVRPKTVTLFVTCWRALLCACFSFQLCQDPTLVVRSALADAASVASLMTTTECVALTLGSLAT